MNTIIEENFVKTFIAKTMQNRFAFELFSAEKRENAFSRLSHNADNYLKESCIYLKDMKLTIDDVETIIKKLAANVKQCYVMAGTYDGETMTLRQGLEKCYNDYSVSITIINDNLAFVKTETGIGSPMKYILSKS